MANRKVKINIDTTANTSGAKQAAKAMDDLAEASKRAGNAASQASGTMNTLDSATTKSAASSRSAGKEASRMGQVAGQAGFQIQDFAVQVGAGTSALTAFSQQAPQLLGVFGPGGAIAGAFVAIGAVATQVFMKMGDDAGTAEQKAEKLKDMLDRVKDSVEKIIDKRIDFGKQKIEDATTNAKLLAGELNNVAINQIKANKAIIESMQQIDKAAIEQAKLRGEDPDKLRAKQAANEGKTRQALLQNEIDSQNQIKKAAEDQIAIAAQELKKRQQLKAENDAILEQERGKLKLLEERLNEEIKLSKQSIKLQGGPNMPPTIVQTQEQRDAKANVDGGQMQTQIKALQDEVRQLAEKSLATGTLAKDIDQAAINLSTAGDDLRTAVKNVNTEIESLNIEAQTEEVTIAQAKLKEDAELLGEKVKALTENVKPLNQAHTDALAVVNENLKEGGITLNEIQSTALAITALNEPIRTAIKNNTAQVNQLILMMQTFQLESAALDRKIKTLQVKDRTPGKVN